MSGPRTVVLLSAAALALGLAAPPPASAGVGQGDRAPEFVQVVDAQGRRASLRRDRNQVIVLTFGASWCPPCKRELPALDKLARDYARAKAGVVFLAVNIDTDRSKGQRFFSQLKIRTVERLFDPRKSTVELYDPPKMPSVFIIRDGIIRHVHGGYVPGDEKHLKTQIDALL
jgi:thiol-disulfide isomerase/thioredoxin